MPAVPDFRQLAYAALDTEWDHQDQPTGEQVDTIVDVVLANDPVRVTAEAVRVAATALLTRIAHMTSNEFACGGEAAERDALRSVLGVDEYPDPPARTLPTGCTWCFAVMANEPGRLVVFLEVPAGTFGGGEFSIKWDEVGGVLCPQLQAYGDGWDTLAGSGLVWALADWPETITLPEVAAILEKTGFVNRTATAVE